MSDTLTGRKGRENLLTDANSSDWRLPFQERKWQAMENASKEVAGKEIACEEIASREYCR